MKKSSWTLPQWQYGFSLIELMISMLLGLLVIAAAGSLFLANRRVYGNTEAIGRIQENQRSAFEMLARDIREAGGNPCTRNVVNMLDTSEPGGAYYNGWSEGISGKDGVGPNGSDEITLHQAGGTEITVTKNETPSANIEVSSTTGLNDNDIVMVCNSEVASIFQVTALPAGNSIQHNSGSGTPGNKKKPFQISQKAFDQAVDGNNAKGYCYKPDTPKNPNCLNDPNGSVAVVVKPTSVRWFIASNGRGGTSLYRQQISNGGASIGAADEIAEGVTNLQATYKVGNAANYVDASAVSNWKNVTAAHVTLTFAAVTGALSQADVQGVDQATLMRTLDGYIVLRNHQDIQ